MRIKQYVRASVLLLGALLLAGALVAPSPSWAFKPSTLIVQASKMALPQVPALPSSPKPLSYGAVSKLAQDLGLAQPTRVNPHLAMLPGDISYWANSRLPPERLRAEFVARKQVLEAADHLKMRIPSQGDLSAVANQLVGPLMTKLAQTQPSPPSAATGGEWRDLVMDGRYLVLSQPDRQLGGQLISSNRSSLPPKMDEGSVRALAQSMGLIRAAPPNAHLGMLGGDISFWAGSRLKPGQMLQEFAARRVILEAAARQNFFIPDQGKLSFLAGQIKGQLGP